jgi:hypothetical protein
MLRVNNLIGFGARRAAFPLDGLSVAAAYSTRRLRTFYAGSAVRVRRSSDNAELDIGFVAGNLDELALLSHIGVSSGFVSAYYDQSGNDRHLLQANTTRQPIIANAGVLVKDGGRVALTTNGGRFMQTIAVATWLNNTNYTVNVVRRLITASGLSLNFFCGTTNVNSEDNRSLSLGPINELFLGFGQWSSSPTSNPAEFAIAETADTLLRVDTYIRAQDRRIFKNGTLIATGVSMGSPLNTLGKFNMGVGYQGEISSSNYPGNISELIVVPTDLTATARQELERNQGVYYGVTVA